MCLPSLNKVDYYYYYYKRCICQSLFSHWSMETHRLLDKRRGFYIRMHMGIKTAVIVSWLHVARFIGSLIMLETQYCPSPFSLMFSLLFKELEFSFYFLAKWQFVHKKNRYTCTGHVFPVTSVVLRKAN